MIRILVLLVLLAGQAGCAVSEEGWSTPDAGLEGCMSAPLFIQTPYMEGTHVNSAGPGVGIYETIAENPALATTTRLIESVRFWYRPAPIGGDAAGYVQLALQSPTGTMVYLEQHEIGASLVGEYPDPVTTQLNVLLPPGWLLQLLSTRLAVIAGVAQNCYVVAQGGDLG